MEHTPGPWSVVKWGDGRYSVDSGPNTIATLNDNGHETLANAHLIEAAPETAAERDRLRAQNADLLVALEGLLREVEYVGTSSVPIMRGWQNSGSAIEARAAIKRAGETT